jgi:anti-sigma factor RsiW
VTADHPSMDTLGDYCADLLPGPAADSVRRHLSGCAHCEANAAAIRQVPTLLAAAGRTPLSMPDLLERRIDDALRRESSTRASHLVAPTETPALRRPRPVSTQRKWPLLAAAAAVIVVGIAGVVLDLGGSTEDSPSASTAPHGRLPSRPSVGSVPGRQATGASGEAAKAARPLSPQNLSSYAVQLSRSTSSRLTARDAPIRTGCAAPHTSAADVVVAARWLGAPAVVVVHLSIRRVTVLDCRTASRVLYSAGY